MKKIVIFLSLLMSVSAFAQMRAVPGQQASQIREAVRAALNKKNLSCQVLQGSQDLQESIGSPDSLKGIVGSLISVSQVAAQDDSQPLLEFSLDYDGTVTKVLITSTEDRKDIQQLTYDVYKKIRLNNGDLLNPQMTDGLELSARLQCQ